MKGRFCFWLDPETNRIAYKYWREKVFERVKDPRKRGHLVPEKEVNPILTKRPSFKLLL